MAAKTNYVSLSIDNLPEEKLPYLLAFAQGFNMPFTLHVSDSLPDESDVNHPIQVTNNFTTDSNKKEQ